LADEDDDDPTSYLVAIEEKFQEVVPTLGDTLGAPVMQIVKSDGSIVPMEGYEDLSDLAENEEFANLIDQFLAE